MYFDSHKITHHMRDVIEIKRLFQVSNFNEFKKQLVILSKELPTSNPIRWNTDPDMINNHKKILGDGFELFVELLILHFGFHSHIGIIGYKAIEPSKDIGADGFGLNLNDEKCAIQCKYVSDITKELTANESNLSNFLVAASFADVDYKDTQFTKPKKLFLFTTGKDLHYFTKDTMYHNTIRTINNKAIKQLVDGNIIFWKSCVDIIKATHKRIEENQEY